MIGKVRKRMDATLIWACLAAYGIVIGVLALLRNFEKQGHGGRWRRAHTTDAEIDEAVKRLR